MTEIYVFKIDENTIYKTSEVAKILRVGDWTVLKLFHDGVLKGMRAGRSYKFLGKHIISMINHEFKKEVKHGK